MFTVSVWVLQEAHVKVGLDVPEITRGNTFRQQYRFNPEEDKGEVGLGRRASDRSIFLSFSQTKGSP